MPTVLDLLHEPAPPMDGVSLVPLMTGRVKHLDLDAYSESAYPRRFGWSELYALRAGRYKFIDAPRPELYDLDVDPGEQHNIFNERSALGSAMAGRVDALTKSAPAREPVDTAVEGETVSRLSALGYVGRGAVDVPRGGPGTFAIDPKDCIGRYNEIVRRRSGFTAQLPDTHPNGANPECGALAFLRTTKDTGSASSNAPR